MHIYACIQGKLLRRFYILACILYRCSSLPLSFLINCEPSAHRSDDDKRIRSLPQAAAIAVPADYPKHRWWYDPAICVWSIWYSGEPGHGRIERRRLDSVVVVVVTAGEDEDHAQGDERVSRGWGCKKAKEKSPSAPRREPATDDAAAGYGRRR